MTRFTALQPDPDNPPGVQGLTEEVRRALEEWGELPTGTELRMTQKPGPYAGREVTYFRIFDSRQAADRGLGVSAYDDLDQHMEVVLRSGHIEPNGTVVMSQGWPIGVRPPPPLPEDEA